MAFLEPFEFEEPEHGEFYSKYSITLGEWYEYGFYDPTSDDWIWDYYTREQYDRVCEKFLGRYYYREVSIFTPAQWALAYMRKFNEIMPKYKVLYERIDAGFNPLQASDEYMKSRDIFSDFPATLLTDNADYASTGADREEERIVEGDIVEKTNTYASRYRDVDVMILDEVEPVLFSGLMASTLPRW